MLNVGADLVVQTGMNMVRRIRLLNLLDPDVQLIQFILYQVIEVVGTTENIGDGAHQEGKDYEAYKLHTHQEQILIGSMTSKVPVTNSCDNFEHVVQTEQVNGQSRLSLKNIRVVCISIMVVEKPGVSAF